VTKDERQSAFDDLSNVLVGVEVSMTARAAKTGDGTIKTAPQRITGKLPAALPQIEEVIEPASLICRSDCGFPAQDRQGSERAAGDRPREVARHCYRAPEIRLPDLH
jgi:hypothetical protein